MLCIINITIMSIKKFDFENSAITDSKSNMWFQGKSVALTLGYVDTTSAIRKHVDDNDKVKRGDIKGVPNDTLTHNEKCQIYINRNGLKQLLIKSRMISSTDIAKRMNIDVSNHKYECKESEALGAIMKTFKGEKMRTQYKVLDYRIDLYFPDYDLCIECDENGHDDRDEEYEKTRQRRITKKLTCQWLRFNPDSKDFNIFDLMNQIFIIIKSKNI